MWNATRWLTLPLVLVASIGTAQAATIRDRAGMFNPDTVRQMGAKLDQIEREFRVPVLIETIDVIPNAEKASAAEKRSLINDLAVQRDGESGNQGIYILISKQDKLISNVLIRRRLANRLSEERRKAIRNAFIADFRSGDFDGGLRHAVQVIGQSLAAGQASVPAPFPARGVPARRPGGAGLGTLLMIGLGIVAVLFVLRLLGGVFGGAGGGYRGPARMGGPGYGGPGYGYGGGGGGGFFSSLFGGIGGALAGNWLYDQFSGRHHGGYGDNASYGDQSSYGGEPASYDQGGDEIVGAGDDGGQGASWGDTGGGDWGGGGGDWGGGGGESGGGGDW